MFDLEDIETVRERLQFRGAQGTTGSQATFLELFEGDADKIVELNKVGNICMSYKSRANFKSDPLQEGRVPLCIPHLYPDLYPQGEFSFF